MAAIDHATNAFFTAWSAMTHYPALTAAFVILGIGLFNIIAIVIERR